MKIFVTGSEGKAGIPICKRFEADGHEVIRYDLKLGNDILESYRSGGFLPLSGIDAVVYLAAIPYPDPAIPEESYVETNVTGTLHVCESMAQWNVRYLLYASSIAVYGLDEKYIPEVTLPAYNWYRESKVKAEEVIRDYVENSGLCAVIMRLASLDQEPIEERLFSVLNTDTLADFVSRRIIEQPDGFDIFDLREPHERAVELPSAVIY